MLLELAGVGLQCLLRRQNPVRADTVEGLDIIRCDAQFFQQQCRHPGCTFGRHCRVAGATLRNRLVEQRLGGRHSKQGSDAHAAG